MMLIGCIRFGSQDIIELEQHQTRYLEESEIEKITTIKTIYTRPMKCVVCNFKLVLPSNPSASPTK